MTTDFHLYSGSGLPLADRGGELPSFIPSITAAHPGLYLADDGLRDAVNVALALGQPLLLTGEPGTGKTQLAASLAHELGLPAPLVFNVKTTSTAHDLFYRYDSLGHFHAAQFDRGARAAEDFISYEALGLAILRSLPPGDAQLPPGFAHARRTRSVVLIDEIDKAPRDLPNDLLNELDAMSFTVRETGRAFHSDPALRPILVLTSNSEKNLPEAFLRRCVFYHIPFPDASRLRKIVDARLGSDHGFSPAQLDAALAHFTAIRELGLKKQPATAEFLAWMRILARLDLDVSALRDGEREALLFSYSVLAKSREDLDLLRQRALAAAPGM